MFKKYRQKKAIEQFKALGYRFHECYDNEQTAKDAAGYVMRRSQFWHAVVTQSGDDWWVMVK